jgi:hypothetical protein
MSDTGRFVVTDLNTGRKTAVEPVSDRDGGVWGDIDPVTKKATGGYGKKHRGAVKESESSLTEKNGFKHVRRVNPEDESVTGV